MTPTLHRLTLREINENPTLMSDEVFVPAEEVDELIEDNVQMAARIRRMGAELRGAEDLLADARADLRDAQKRIEELSSKGGEDGEQARQTSGLKSQVEERADREDGQAEGTEPG